MLSRKFPESDQGFTLFEVLISLLIAVMFVLTALQLMALATYAKVRAKEQAEATFWIQEDLENIKLEAKTYSTLSADAAAGATSISVNNPSDFNSGDTIILAGDSTYYTVSNISSNTLTLSSGLAKGHSATNPAENLVTSTQKCSASSISTGWANSLREKIEPSYSGPSHSIKALSSSSKNYYVQKTMTVKNQTPFNILEIQYQVIDEGTTVNSTHNPDTQGVAHGSDPDDRLILRLYTEVIPDAAVQCSL